MQISSKQPVKTILILCFLMLSLTGISQFSDNFTEGAKSLSMAGNGVSLKNIDAIRNNQAGLAYLNSAVIGLHVENRFLIASIHTVGLDIASPTKFGVFGISLHSFGNEIYKQQKLGFAYARKLLNNLSIGGQLDVLHTGITNYGNTINLTFELGVYSEIFDNLHAAAHVYSPGKIKITEHDAEPSHLRFGIKYLVSKKLNLYSEFNKNLTQKYDLRFGVAYQLIKPLQIRIGIATRNENFAFGLSYIYKQFAIDFAFTQHPILGSSPGLSLKYIVQDIKS